MLGDWRSAFDSYLRDFPSTEVEEPMMPTRNARPAAAAAAAPNIVWEDDEADPTFFQATAEIAKAKQPFSIVDVGKENMYTRVGQYLNNPAVQYRERNQRNDVLRITAEMEEQARSDVDAAKMELAATGRGPHLMRLVGDVSLQRFNREDRAIPEGMKRLPGLDMYLLTLTPNTEGVPPDTMMLAYIRELKNVWLPMLQRSLGTSSRDMWVSVRTQNWPVPDDFGLTRDDEDYRRTVRLSDQNFVLNLMRAIFVTDPRSATKTGTWSDDVWGDDDEQDPEQPLMKVTVMYSPSAGSNPFTADRVVIGELAVDGTTDPLTLLTKNKIKTFKAAHVAATNSGLCLLIAIYFSPVRVYDTTTVPQKQYTHAYMLDCPTPMPPASRIEIGSGATWFVSKLRHHTLGPDPAGTVTKKHDVYRADDLMTEILAKSTRVLEENHITLPGADGLPIEALQIIANHYRIYIRAVIEESRSIRMFAPTESRPGERHVVTIYIANHHAYAVCKPEKLLAILHGAWSSSSTFEVQVRRSVDLPQGSTQDVCDVCPVCSNVLLQKQVCHRCNSITLRAVAARNPTPQEVKVDDPPQLTQVEAPDTVRDEHAWVVAVAPFWDGCRSIPRDMPSEFPGDLGYEDPLINDPQWGSHVQMEADVTATEEPIYEEVDFDPSQELEIPPRTEVQTHEAARPPNIIFVLRGEGLNSLTSTLKNFFDGIGMPIQLSGINAESWEEAAFKTLDQAFSPITHDQLSNRLLYVGVAPSNVRNIHRQVIRDARSTATDRSVFSWEGVRLTEHDYHWPETNLRISRDCAYILPLEEMASLQKRTCRRFRQAVRMTANNTTTLQRALINHFWMQPTKCPGRMSDAPFLLRRWCKPWRGSPSHGRFCTMCASVIVTQICTKSEKDKESGEIIIEGEPTDVDAFSHSQCPDGCLLPEERLMMCAACGDPWPLSLIHRGEREAPQDSFTTTNTSGHVCNCRVKIREEGGSQMDPEEEEEEGAEETKESDEEETTWVFDLETAQDAVNDPTRRSQTTVAVLMKVDPELPHSQWEYYCWIRDPTIPPVKSAEGEPTATPRRNMYTRDPLSALCRFMFFTPRKFQKASIFSHNGGRFDIQFVFGWALRHALELGRLVKPRDRTKKQYYVMPKFKVPLAVGGSAGNIIAWHFTRGSGANKANIRFKDTAKLLPMTLSALPKTFGFQDQVKKGFFPHSWNTLERWDSNPRITPPLDELQSTTDKESAQRELKAWYDERGGEGAPWDAREECAEYCVDDCAVLGTAILRFRILFSEMMRRVVGHPIDPTQFNTCASMSVQLAFYIRKLRNQTSVRNMPRDFAPYDTDGKVSMIVRAAKVLHRHNGFVATSMPFTPKSIAYWHSLEGLVFGSCETIDHISYNGPLGPADKYVQYASGTAEAMYDCRVCGQQTLSGGRHEGDCILHNCRPVPTMAASLIRSSIASFNQRFPKGGRHGSCTATLVEDFDLYKIDPRDAFFGGRTENFACRFVSTPENLCHIEMADVTSEYPFICAARELPTGSPVTFYGHQCSAELARKPSSQGGYFGIIKCKVRAPHDLIIPILPQRGGATKSTLSDAPGKLVFALYNVNDMDSKEWVGTYTTPELERALHHGYEVLEVYSVMHWDERQREVGPLRNFVDSLMKVKFEAEGIEKAGDVLDNWVIQNNFQMKKGRLETFKSLPEEARRQFCRHYSELLHELNKGIGVPDPDVMFHSPEKNEGLLRISKLLLNSCWGKVGQRDFQCDTRIITNQCDLMKMAMDDRINFDASNVHPVWCDDDDDTGIYIASANFKENHIRTSPTTHCAFAAFVTAWGRLRLFDGMTEIASAPHFEDPALTLEQRRNVPQGWARILYCDTDSIAFVQCDNAPPFIQKRPGLGEFADDLKGVRGLRFVCWGAKSYRLDCADNSTPYDVNTKYTKLRAKGIVMTPANEQLLTFDYCSALVTHAAQPTGKCQACIWMKRKIIREHVLQGMLPSAIQATAEERAQKAAALSETLPFSRTWQAMDERMSTLLSEQPESVQRQARNRCFLCGCCYTTPTMQISSGWKADSGRAVVVRSIRKVLQLTTGKRLIVPVEGDSNANIYTVPFGYPTLGEHPIAAASVPATLRQVQAYLQGSAEEPKRELQDEYSVEDDEPTRSVRQRR